MPYSTPSSKCRPAGRASSVPDPEARRDIPADPSDGPHLYRYVRNDPLNHVDPTGLCSNSLSNTKLSLTPDWTGFPTLPSTFTTFNLTPRAASAPAAPTVSASPAPAPAAAPMTSAPQLPNYFTGVGSNTDNNWQTSRPAITAPTANTSGLNFLNYGLSLSQANIQSAAQSRNPVESYKLTRSEGIDLINNTVSLVLTTDSTVYGIDAIRSKSGGALQFSSKLNTLNNSLGFASVIAQTALAPADQKLETAARGLFNWEAGIGAAEGVSAVVLPFYPPAAPVAGGVAAMVVGLGGR